MVKDPIQTVDLAKLFVNGVGVASQRREVMTITMLDMTADRDI
jgi:hypothetical protein